MICGSMPDALTLAALNEAEAMPFGQAIRATPYLIVYGSLRRDAGSVRSTVLEDLGATYKADVRLENFRLVSIYEGRFPTVEPHVGGVVNAEMWEASTEFLWVHLDGIESHPFFYRRELVVVKDGTVKLSDSPPAAGEPEGEYAAWIYVMTADNLSAIRAQGRAEPFDGADWVSARAF